jgi:large subunit ribosomal protein L20
MHLKKALQYAYRDRKTKKRNFRSLWIQRINAAVRKYDLILFRIYGFLHKNNIDLNRKTLADMALNNPQAFEEIVKKVKA